MTPPGWLARGAIAAVLVAWWLPLGASSAQVGGPPAPAFFVPTTSVVPTTSFVPAASSATPQSPAACAASAVRPLLNNDPYQWKAGTDVPVWIDGDGRAARGEHRNPKPEFTLDAMEARAIFIGVDQWGGIPDTGVSFSLLNDNADRTARYWVTVAWPNASLEFTASNGRLKTVQCQVPPGSLGAAAYTCRFEDELYETSQSHTVGAAITMINTRHAYTDLMGATRNTWRPVSPEWRTALTKLGAHENGHIMGLTDLPAVDADGQSRPHVMKPFNGANDAAPHGGSPRLAPVTDCDRATILGHQSGQYRRWVCAGEGAVRPPACPGSAQPLCRNPAVQYPAPTWSCETPPAR